MEKSELRLREHTLIPDQNTIEVWHDGKMIATVYGGDGPGIRVLTKYPYDVVRGGPTISGELPNVIEIKVEVKK